MPNRTDDNSADIVSALRKIGAEWIPTSGDPKIGFDGLVIFRGQVKLVEIKNGARPLSAQTLTPVEKARKAQVEAAGVTYWIVKNVDEALKMIGVWDCD